MDKELDEDFKPIKRCCVCGGFICDCECDPDDDLDLSESESVKEGEGK